MGTEYDYIIVGSGAGGSTLAYRLARSGRVLVLEAGAPDDDPLHRMPKGHFLTMRGDAYAYRYPTVRVAGVGDTGDWVRGKVVGGGTTINAMIYSRGAEADFEALARHAGSGHWGWDSFLAAYRAMEDHELGASPSRGDGGPLGVSVPGVADELAARLFEAGGKLGWEHVEDVNDGDGERIGFTPSTIRHGRRTSAADAFLRPALRAGVTLETGVRAERVLFAGRRAVGVACRRGGVAVEYRARKEVIIAGGAVESPLLLERSGIGRPDLLRDLGIEVLAAAPNVGERVIEQRIAMVQVRFGRELGVGAELHALFRRDDLGAGGEPGADGLLGTSGYDITFHTKSEPHLARPDLCGAVVPFPIDPAADGFQPAGYPGMLIGLYQTRPETTGTIHSSMAGPSSPVIAPRFLETGTDQRAASRILGRIRALLGTAPLAEVIEAEDFPTGAVLSFPEPALDYVRRHGTSSSHAVGSCAMGPSDDDVLDAELRVRGVNGLRVVDASAFPFQVSANIGAPTMALAWLAADLFD
ncbi:GMC family oxidoreductase N-terminal domain-containing protein [Spongiactinospora sp. TRM90649]|uniref:GMC family oxidoreductase n=1 Tax=Spongiactinospora sp. TRM90649 TaxID=3031114 RepID=UPI0023FA1817|nr:GMC family oxidoreductase N-terminal domain-containing protein [Spongiactinospora sp. TRM90649]MDF5757540.1 GMC family oxidoreductase N-terminal domain-containing protein [Spongiactinospora sp. TRM90649]